MNPKIILAFAGGVLLAGAGAFFLSSGRGPAKGSTPETGFQTPALVQDVASIEPEKPLPPWPKAFNKPSAMRPVSAKKSGAASSVAHAPVLVAKTEPPVSNSSVSAPPSSLPAVSNPRPSDPRSNAPSTFEDPGPRQAVKPARIPAQVTIPEGTSITVRINSTLSTEKSQDGETFTGTLDTPIVIDEMVIAEKGSRVEGKVAESTPSGRVKGRASLALVLTSLNTSDGQKITIRTDNFVREGESSTKNDAAKIGIGAAAGAALGAIFGGGKGAAIGAASGGAAGTGVVLATRGKPAVIAVETRVPFRLAAAVTVIEKIP